MTLNLTAYRLRQQRRRMRLTQREVGDRLHVTAMTISKYETCRLPPTQMLIELARLYGVSTDYLLGVTDKANKKSEEKPHEQETP